MTLPLEATLVFSSVSRRPASEADNGASAVPECNLSMIDTNAIGTGVNI